jgi:hypothetical protein
MSLSPLSPTSPNGLPTPTQVAQSNVRETNPQPKPTPSSTTQTPTASGQPRVPESAIKKAVGGQAGLPTSTQIRTRANVNDGKVNVETQVQIKVPQGKNDAILLQGTVNSKNVVGARVGYEKTTELNRQLNLTSGFGVDIKTNGSKVVDGSLSIKRSSGNFSASLTAAGEISNQGSSLKLNPEIGIKVTDSLSANAGREQSLTNPSDSFNYVGAAVDINKDFSAGIRFDDKGNTRFETKFTF